ncbi:NAD(P)H-dependent flavin oxidoreductase [Sphingobium baderi]|uniref:NAD(P)H-dependent flavin oxidoreductase n=1 Tax=Sphingobium baderi TaxID=1332080 RepID=UPI002B40AA54|nr:nitronate monooxygenase family protein [Sphingobium baderi]WRD75350.1 nitronate monooxygenase family protein [Sphingobium baderi]
MAIPDKLLANLAIPAIAAPMFLASGPDLVVEVCRSGLIGTFPALNARTTGALANWLDEIAERLSDSPAPAAFGINQIVHKSNPRLDADLKVTVDHKVPLVITSLGAAKEVVDAVHSYGGVVFHDVINSRHAEKAATAGVDGLIAVAAGAGGHAGTLNPFALISEIRSFFDGTVILAGAITNGRQIAAARLMDADMGYVGTRFIATQEATVQTDYKEMLTQTGAADIVYTSGISGVNASFMRPSIIAAGMDPDDLPTDAKLDMGNEGRAWRDIWSAGHGVGSIRDIPTAAQLCARLISEYRKAMAGAAHDPFTR